VDSPACSGPSRLGDDDVAMWDQKKLTPTKGGKEKRVMCAEKNSNRAKRRRGGKAVKRLANQRVTEETNINRGEKGAVKVCAGKETAKDRKQGGG